MVPGNIPIAQYVINLHIYASDAEFYHAFAQYYIHTQANLSDCLTFLSYIPVDAVIPLWTMLRHLRLKQEGREPSLSQIAQALSPQWLRSTSSQCALITAYFEIFLHSKNLLSEAGFQWLKSFHHDTAQGLVDVNLYNTILFYYVRPLIERLPPDILSIDTVLSYHHYSMLEVMWDNEIISPADAVGLFTRLLQFGPPSQHIYREHQDFLVKIAGVNAAALSSNDQRRGQIVPMMVRSQYVQLIPRWLELFQPPPAYIFPLINDYSHFAHFWRSYLIKKFKEQLTHSSVREKQTFELDSYLLKKMPTSEKAEELWGHIYYYGWGALIDETTGLTPPELLLRSLNDKEDRKKFFRWLNSGYPIDVSGRASLIQQARTLGDFALADLLTQRQSHIFALERNQRRQHNRQPQPITYSRDSVTALQARSGQYNPRWA